MKAGVLVLFVALSALPSSPVAAQCEGRDCYPRYYRFDNCPAFMSRPPDLRLRRHALRRLAAALDEQASVVVQFAKDDAGQLVQNAVGRFAEEARRFHEGFSRGRFGFADLSLAIGHLTNAADVVERRLDPNRAAGISFRDEWDNVKATLDELRAALQDPCWDGTYYRLY